MRHREFDKQILHNGVVHTMDDADTTVPAIGFAAGRVTASGSLEDARRATPGADEFDLSGEAVYPGFIDAHHHLCFAATYANFAEVRTPPFRSLDAILAEIGRLAENRKEGQWIVAVGYNDLNLSDHRKPTRFELDAVAPNHPVLLIHFSYHEGVLNSRGLARTGLVDQSSDPPGGWIGRTPRGEPDGRVFERCFGQAEQTARNALIAEDREGWFRNANAYQERVLAAGITHICDAAVPPGMEALYREWQARDELRLGITMMPLVENMFSAPDARLDGSVTGWHERRLSVGALKLFTDGGTSCAMCLSLRQAIVQFATMLGRLLRQRSLLPWRLARQQQPRYAPDGFLHTGVLYYQAAELEGIVRGAVERGFSVGIHAGGNEAIRQAITTLGRSRPGPLPPRIDHFFFAEEESLRRAADAGIHAVVQPVQLHDTGDWLLQTGLPSHLGYQPFRRMAEAGIVLAGSSDAPVCSFSVMAAIDTAVRRRLASGAVSDADESLQVARALRMYTRGAAATLGMENEIGLLVAGARADAVILSEDPQTVPAARLSDIGAITTFAGRHRFDA